MKFSLKFPKVRDLSEKPVQSIPVVILYVDTFQNAELAKQHASRTLPQQMYLTSTNLISFVPGT